jgi:hypothetical protein
LVIPVVVEGVHIAEVGSSAERRAGGGGEDEVEGGDEEGGARQGLGTQVLLIQVGSFRYRARVRYILRGVLGNKCAGHHNLKRVKIREIM